jgi:hypothetical protein
VVLLRANVALLYKEDLARLKGSIRAEDKVKAEKLKTLEIDPDETFEAKLKVRPPANALARTFTHLERQLYPLSCVSAALLCIPGSV